MKEVYGIIAVVIIIASLALLLAMAVSILAYGAPLNLPVGILGFALLGIGLSEYRRAAGI